ncbi:MAG TPA: DinB family protein [Acidimicrobiia bacterium]|nr:DinB family protein [Acidimicrobiia bacterium]
MRESRLARDPRFTPAVGLLVAMLDECRGRTLSHLQDLDAQMIDAEVSGHPNTIGTILYHIAAIELDWLYAEILGEDFPEEAAAWFPVDVRDDTGRLTSVTGESLGRHRERLAWVRDLLHDGLAGKDDAFLFEDRPTDGGTVTSEWVMHHLLQHEAEHRGQIGELATALR